MVLIALEQMYCVQGIIFKKKNIKWLLSKVHKNVGTLFDATKILKNQLQQVFHHIEELFNEAENHLCMVLWVSAVLYSTLVFTKHP